MAAGATIVDPLFSEVVDGPLRDILRERRYGPRLSTRNRAYYEVRPFIPLPVRHLLQHLARPRDVDPTWYVDSELLDAYAGRLAGATRPLVDLWPGGHGFAVALTHDVETAEGFAAIEPVVALETRLGFRSSWNLVSHKYRIDDGYVASLKDRGFEIGVHGYNHDGRAYLSRGRFERRLRYVNGTAKPRFGAVGFRSPAAHRNLEWLQGLEMEYDASVFDVDPFQPMPGGTRSPWPFLAGKLVELPYTLPQDHVLFIVLREGSDRVWREKARWLMAHGGLLCLITHPDYLKDPAVMRHYTSFLEWLADQAGSWRALPREVARWWRRRAASRVEGGPGLERVVGPAADEAGVSRVSVADGELVLERLARAAEG